MRRAHRSLAFLLLTLWPAACGPRERAVKLAVAVPLTGDLGTEGEGIYRAVELAVEEANASGRFPYRLEAEPFDDRGDSREAVNVANLIISDRNTVAVIGHYNSGCAAAAARVYALAGVPMISPTATAPEVTGQQLEPDWQGPRVAFRVIPTDDVQGPFAAEFVYRRLRLRRVAVVDDGTTYGRGLAGRFAQTFAGLGGKVVSEDRIGLGDRDFKELLSRVRQAQPQGLYFGGLYTEAGLLVRQMRELGMKTPFFSGDGAKTPSLFDVAGAAADGAYLTIMGVPVEKLPGARKFVEDYQRRWAKEGEGLKPYDHAGYEAARIVFDALETVGPGGRYDRAKILEALRRTRHEGLLGTTAFDAKGDTVNKAVTMTRARAENRVFDPLDWPRR